METRRFLKLLEKNAKKKSLLKHPFYQMWNDGKLPYKTLVEYAEQYYHFTDNFPRFVASVYKNCNNAEIRREILNNLVEEEIGNNTKPHAVLWLQFCDALGMKRKEIFQAKRFNKTKALLENFENSTSNDFLKGVGCLLAYEMQLPEIAKTKKDGLKKHYNIKNGGGLEFFNVHIKADIRHSNVWKNILIKYATDSKIQNKIIKSFNKSLNVQWSFLDGILEKCF